MIKLLKEYCLSGYNFRIRQVIYTFSDSKIETIKKRNNTKVEEGPIVVLCIKNDLKRIQMLVNHYRFLGVKRFAFLDNGSSDGTYEWLLNQNDIDLYRCLEPYKTLVKEGWINRVVSHYGFNQWYILTDSDELLVYRRMETHSLNDLIDWCEKHGIKRIKGLTLDTYSENKLFDFNGNIKQAYRWIDTDSYKEIVVMRGGKRIKQVVGGPRYRLMNTKITLTKFPLLYFEPGTISDSAHFQFPHYNIDTTPCTVGILHYKFINEDHSEYEKRANKNSGFSANGKYYKQYVNYMKTSSNKGFMYEGSKEFTSSDVLDSISIIQKKVFNDD